MMNAEQHQRWLDVSAARFDFADGPDCTVRTTFKLEEGRLIVCMPGQRVGTVFKGGAHLYSIPLEHAPEGGTDA